MPMGHSVLTEESAAEDGVLRFRPINYLGSKLRIIDAISAQASSIRCGPGPIVDLFSGSGTTTYALAAHAPVLSVDIQEYARVLASALGASQEIRRAVAGRINTLYRTRRHLAILDAVQPLVNLEERRLKLAEAGDVLPMARLIEAGPVWSDDCERSFDDSELLQARGEVRTRLAALRNELGWFPSTSALYGGLYVSFAQAASADSLRILCAGLESEERDVGLAIACAALSDIVNTVGKHFAQPLALRTRAGAAKPQLARKLVTDRSKMFESAVSTATAQFSLFENARFPISAIRQDYATFLSELSSGPSVVYADPPYTRDHYSRYYHVLETVCRDDAPELSRSNLGGGTRTSRGAYRVDRHQSPFCIRSQAPAAFASLFSCVAQAGSPLVVSYSPFSSSDGSHPRMMTIDELTDLASSRFGRVELIGVGQFAHAKLNARRHELSASDEAEILLLCSLPRG